MHLMAVFQLSQGSVATLGEVGDIHTSHMSFILKSNSEDSKKIR